jgi:hypothetical protein
MGRRNAGLPEDRRIECRIGINLGDVVEEEDGDPMGDGAMQGGSTQPRCCGGCSDRVEK